MYCVAHLFCESKQKINIRILIFSQINQIEIQATAAGKDKQRKIRFRP